MAQASGPVVPFGAQVGAVPPRLGGVRRGETRFYIREPNGYSVELLYELPRAMWEGDINAALNHCVAMPTIGEAALRDRTEGLPVFKPAPAKEGVSSIG